MTFRDIEIFVSIYVHGSMSKAAEALFVTQPSVSQTIRQLEKEFGIKLFNRLSHKLYLTEEGQVFLDYSKKILHLKEETEIAINSMKGNTSINIGATITVGTYFLPVLLGKIKEDYPALKIKTYIYNTVAIVKEINLSKLDMAIVEGKIIDPAIKTSPFYEDELVLVCEKDHPLAKVKNLSAKMLGGEEFILREEGSGSRLLFEENMKQRGLDFSVGHVYNNNEAIYNAARQGVGLGVVSKLALKERDGKVVCLEIEDFKMYRDFVVAFHKDKYVTEAMKDIIKEINLVKI